MKKNFSLLFRTHFTISLEIKGKDRKKKAFTLLFYYISLYIFRIQFYLVVPSQQKHHLDFKSSTVASHKFCKQERQKSSSICYFFSNLETLVENPRYKQKLLLLQRMYGFNTLLQHLCVAHLKNIAVVNQWNIITG